METKELKLSYPWFSNQYTIVLSFLTILIFMLYMVHLSFVQEDWHWLLLGLPVLIVLPGRIIDFYWCIYKAPRIVYVRGETVDIEMRTDECFSIKLDDIDRIEYKKSFLDSSPFDVKILSAKLEHELLLSSLHMCNVDIFIKLLRESNQKCKIDDVWLEKLATKKKSSIYRYI